MDPFREVDAAALERTAQLEDENEELRRRVAALEADKDKRTSTSRAREDLERELDEARTEAVTERMRAADLAKKRSFAVSPIQAFGAGVVVGFTLAFVARPR